ncbi:MAG TPA: hypothetical protein VH682_31320 [Gemmataceae bacterium]|jgi:hypothetical protein
MDKTAAKDRLVAVVRNLAAEKRNELDRLKQECSGLARPDFIWHYLLQSFSTMGRASGWHGLIGNRDNYERITYQALSELTPEARNARVREVCRAAAIRMPDKKADYILGCFEIVKQLGGPEVAKAKLLSQPGRDAKIHFLQSFPGIGPKYARNIMMDVYHEDFRDSIALDIRILAISDALGLSFASYAEHESFYIDVARHAGLNGWELDRLLFNFRPEVESRLGIAGARPSLLQVRSTQQLSGKECLAPSMISTVGLAPARDFVVTRLSPRAEVIAQLQELHKMVLDLCPECLVKQRGDGGLIYVPPQRQHAARNKNLLTMWAESAGVRLRIMPDSEEMYDRSQQATYRQRLDRLYSDLISRTD